MSTFPKTFDATQPVIASPNFYGKTIPTGIQDINSLKNATNGGIATTDVAVGYGDKYNIDIFGDMQRFEPEETPMLSIIANLNSQSTSVPGGTAINDYEGDAWVDFSLDGFRLNNLLADVSSENTGTGRQIGAHSGNRIQSVPVELDSASYKGGHLYLYPLKLTTGEYTVADALIYDSGTPADSQIMNGTTAGNEYGFARNIAPLSLTNKVGFGLINRPDMGGSVNQTISALKNLLRVYKYTELAGTNTTRYTWNTAVDANIYFCFDTIPLLEFSTTSGDLGIAVNKHEIIAKIYQFGWDSAGHVWFVLDFSANGSNLDATAAAGLTATDACSGWAIDANKQIIHNGTSVYSIDAAVVLGINPTYGASATAFYTTHATDPSFGVPVRCAYIGGVDYAPSPIPEGDLLGTAENFVRHRERVAWTTQIFASGKYGITGTAQASSFRFGDDMQVTRARHLRTYKKKKEAAYLYGIGFETTNTNSSDAFLNGQPVRATSGLFDYAKYPIRYLSTVMPTVGGSETFAGQNLMNWIDELTYSLAAHRQKGARSFTFLTSRNIMRKLSILNSLYTGAGQNTASALGGHVQIQKPSQITFGLEVFSYTSPYGTVNFVHEPSFDIGSNVRIPRWIFGADLNPRNMMLSIDTQNIREYVLRPDKILGNLQELDRDGFLEGMRGESGFFCRFARNHAVIKVA